MKVFREQHKLVLPKSYGRSKGLHISEVIRDLALASNTLDKKWAKDEGMPLEDQNTNMMQIGLAWEDYLDRSKQHPEIEYHPGEMMVQTDICAYCGDFITEHLTDEHDHEPKRLKVYMSPDGLTWKDGYLILFLNEFKFTLKSCRDFAQSLRLNAKKSRMWLWQIKAYLFGTGTLAAKLHVMFGAGNYSYDSSDPESIAVYNVFRLEFDESEITENWNMLMEHARAMIREGRYVEENS